MRKKLSGWSKLVVGLLGCPVVNAAETTQVPRHPQGVYVIVGPNEFSDLDLLVKNPAVTPGWLRLQREWSEFVRHPWADRDFARV